MTAAKDYRAGLGRLPGEPEPPAPPLGGWITPTPIDSPTPIDPALLGDVMGRMALAVAESTQTHPDLAVAVALGVMSAAIGGRLEVEARPDYRVPVGLYIAPIVPSGEGKSPVVRHLSAPLRAIERELVEATHSEVERGRSRYRAAEKRRDKAENVAASAKGTERYVAESDLDAAVADLVAMREPAHVRLLADDVTPEALVSLLAAHSSMAVVSSEAGLFGTLAGRYSGGEANLDAVLKAWDCESISVDRKGRAPESIERPALTLVLTAQPVVIEAVMADPVLAGRGLPQRFLYVIPGALVGNRNTEPEPLPAALVAEWEKLIRDVSATLRGGSVGFVWPSLRVCSLSPEARQEWVRFKRELEPRLGDLGDLYGCRAWSTKLESQILRVAGVLHVADNPTDYPSRPVSADVMARAVQVGTALTSHAAVIFGPTGAGTGQLRRVLRWLLRAARSTFSERDAFYALRTSAMPTMEGFTPLLNQLCDWGYVYLLEDDGLPRGGRPSRRYAVNPEYLEKATQNPQNPDNGGVA